MDSAAVILLIGVWALVSPRGAGSHLLSNLAPVLAAFFLVWSFAAYLATALGANLAIPDLLQSVGIYCFRSPPPVFLPLAAQTLMTVVLGGLARSRIHGSFAEYGSVS